jgi:hypothetical protein
MPVEVIVGPAVRAADRRTPERLAEDAADHAAGNGADRTGDEEAGSGTGPGANPVCARHRHSYKYGGRERPSPTEAFSFGSSPDSTRRLHRATDAVNRPLKRESLTNSWQSSGGFWTAQPLALRVFIRRQSPAD